MKKITFLLCLLSLTFGFAQTNLEDFEGSPAAVFSGFEGLAGVSEVADPLNASNTVLELVSQAAGNPWQGAELLMQSNNMDLSSDITVDVDVYSTVAFDLFGKVENGVGGALDSATATAYTAVGTWQTLTLTFNQSLDGTDPANGEYGKIAFFPNWNIGLPGWNNPAGDFTIYIDNITAVAGAALGGPTCSDGVMNGNETGVDCGGPDCPACPASPSGPAPPLNEGNLQVYSIYNDTNGYTNTFPFIYSFGSTQGEPNLDMGGGTNLALQFDFSLDGYGAGEGGPDDVSGFNFVSFDYWAVSGVPGFQFRMIDNDGAVEEFAYEVGTNEAVVSETWTRVVIPMSYFTGLGFDSTNFFQWKFNAFMESVAQGGVVYVDNIILSTGNPLSVNNVEANEFVTFPNPTKNSWNITSNNVIKTVAVYDVLGKQVASLAPNATEVEIDGTTLTQGLYFARIEGERGSETVKLIKE